MSVQVQESDDTYKIVCKQCQHFIRVGKGTAEQYEKDPISFRCSLCYVEPGQPKLLRTLIHCATCTQTFDSRTMCECPPQFSTIKIVYDPKNKWMKKDWNKDYGAYNSKTTLKFNKIVRNRKLEAEQRQIRVDKNLEKTVQLLEKLVEQKEGKDVQEKKSKD